jgi:hypothetical protein
MLRIHDRVSSRSIGEHRVNIANIIAARLRGLASWTPRSRSLINPTFAAYTWGLKTHVAV